MPITEIQYSVEITGHEAPYKWHVTRKEEDKSTTVAQIGGDADTIEQAVELATAAAREDHWKLIHSRTKRSIPVFSGPSAVTTDGSWLSDEELSKLTEQ